MMKWTDNLLQIVSLVGIIFMIAGMIQYLFAPKKINSLYGYRTKSSMQSEGRWHFAQKYSAIKLIAVGLFLLIISMLPLVVEMNETLQIVIQPGIILLGTVYLFYSTEKALKTRFPKN